MSSLRLTSKLTFFIVITLFFVIIKQTIEIPTLCDPKSKYVWKNVRLPMNQREMLTVTKFGFPMIVDNNDKMVSMLILNTGVWQGGLANMMQHIIKPGDNVLNLGSQSGMQMLMMAYQVGPTGKVFVFQPYSFSYKIMRKSVFLNNLQDRVTTYNLGASNYFGIGKMTISYGNTGGSQIHERQNFKQDKLQQTNTKLQDQMSKVSGVQSQQVVVAPVDDVLPQNISLDFALIDIQKMQIQALAGMKRVIKRSPNLIIFTQWQWGVNPFRDNALGRQVIQFLFDQGYKFYLVNPTNECRPPIYTQKANFESLDIKGNVNLILIPPTKSLPTY